MLAKLLDKERKKVRKILLHYLFIAAVRFLENLLCPPDFNLFMSAPCYELHGKWKGHNKSKPPFIRIKKRILWETLRNRQNRIKVVSANIFRKLWLGWLSAEIDTNMRQLPAASYLRCFSLSTIAKNTIPFARLSSFICVFFRSCE